MTYLYAVNPISARLLNQQLAAPLYRDPAELVSYMAAIQAQEYRLMHWAVCMRTKRPSLKDFTKAFDSGRILRLHLMRGTWQLISGEDYAWMTELFCEKARRVILGWMHANGISLPPAEIMSIREILGQTTREKGSATADDFAQALKERGLEMDSHRLSYHIRMAELDSFLCNGNLHPSKATYSLVSEKVKAAKDIDREEAISILADRYFKSRTPATLEDFVWWSGLGIGICRKGIASLGDKLHCETIGGTEYYVHEESRTKGFRKDSYLLLPSYDEYLISYKSRHLVLDEKHRHLAHNNSGNFNPIFAHDGVVCGNWSPFGKTPAFRFFNDNGPVPDGLAREWDAYQTFKNNFQSDLQENR